MNNDMFLDFGKKGIIEYWDFNIDVNKNIEEQLEELKEDLVLVKFNEGKVLLDIGYYPSHTINGTFVIYLIQNGDWDNPIEKIECSDIKKLQESINKIMLMVNL